MNNYYFDLGAFEALSCLASNALLTFTNSQSQEQQESLQV